MRISFFEPTVCGDQIEINCRVLQAVVDDAYFIVAVCLNVCKNTIRQLCAIEVDTV